jgi:hypothetical protein
MKRGAPSRGDHVALACSCEAEVLVSRIVMLPRHSFARITKKGSRCHGLGHMAGRRTLIRWSGTGRRRFNDVHAKPIR